MKRFFFITILALLLCHLSFSQSGFDVYNTLTEEKWLPRQSIRTVFQDSKGNMWVGTNAGLYKYNLYETVNYNLSQRTTNRLLNNTIHAINEDAKGNILVGTESGLGALNPISGNFTVLTPSDETILEIVKATDGTVWMINGVGDVFRIGSDVSQIKPNGLNPFLRLADTDKNLARKLTTIFILPDGRPLLGTTDGLLVVNTQNRTVRRTAITANITRIYAKDEKEIYFGTADKGLTVVRTADASLLKILSSQNLTEAGVYITGILPVDKDKLVVTSSQQVGFVMQEKAGIRYQSASANANIFSEGGLGNAFIDRTGNIWLGSKRGLYKLKRQALDVSFLLLDNKEALAKNIQDVFYDGDRHLFALNGSPIVTRINVVTGAKDDLRFPFKMVTRMRQASNGNIVVAAERKLVEIPKALLYGNAVSVFNVIYHNDAYAPIDDFREVQPGEWWIASWTDGLLRAMQNPNTTPSKAFDAAQKKFPAGTHLFSMLAGKQANVWIASRGEGLLRVNLADNSVNVYRKEQGLSNRLICLKQDKDGNVWIGSRGDGLFRYDAAKNLFTSFDTKSGLPSNTICSIEETPAGELWVSTLNGLAKFSRSAMMPFTSFGAEDGINNPEHNFNVSATGKNGTVYFGNGNGIYKVSSTPVTQSQTFPVVWTGFDLLTRNGLEQKDAVDSSAQWLSQVLSSTNPVVLKHNQNNIRIGFAALDFTSPEKNRYAYRLAGRDTSWQFLEGTRQSVQFFDLPPGRYVLEVKSATAVSDWTIEPQRLAIEIEPSFWASRTGYILYAVMAVIAIVIAFVLRRRWVRLQKKLAQEIHTGELHNQQMVFYTDLSHEIKNRITLLLGPLEQALHGKKVNQSVLTNLYDQGLRLKKLTDQIMNIRKRESGSFLLNVAEENVRQKIETLCREAEPLAVLKGVRFSVDSLKEDISGWCDEELLEIVVMNLLSNAVKYCKVDGSVELKLDQQYLGKADLKSIECEGSYLICSVTDTGIGIPAADIEKITAPFYRAENIRDNKKEMGGTGIGLDLVARLVKMHHGHLEIRSEAQQFTTVTLYLPLDKHCYALNERKPNLDHAPVVMEAAPLQELILPTGGEKLLDEQGVKPTEWTLLLVDDNPEILSLLTSVLADDFRLLTANDGEEALQTMAKEEVNLVLSDLDMPRMDGLTLCQKLKASKEWKAIPFLILTGRNSEEQKLVCFKYGADDFIEKPFGNELLRWRVKSLLRNNAAKAKLKTVVVVEPKADIPQGPGDKFIQDIVNLIEKNIDKDFLDVDFLAENMYTSRATFYRRMEQAVGESPSVFIRKYRLKKAAMYLEAGHSVSEAANKTGFSSSKYFAKCFQKEFGVTPSAFAESKNEK